MPEYSIAISVGGDESAVYFSPNPQEVSVGDLVSWANFTSKAVTVVIAGSGKEFPARSYGSTDAYKVTAAATYSCKGLRGTGYITIKAIVAFMLLLACFFTPSLQAQTCADLIGGELKEIPKIDQVNNDTPGQLVTTGEKQLIAFIKPPRVTGKIAPANLNCVAQWVRTYRTTEPGPNDQNPMLAPTTLPMPGPTIRARVGDLVKVTFLNLIDPINFPNTDTGDCDKVSNDTGEVYPQTDKFPNCFHGSVFTNVHYHGTHTSPSSTADNVFLEIVPSPRASSSARTPSITAATVKTDFDKFYGDCKSMLNRPDTPQQWPKIWTDLPENYRNLQDTMLEAEQPKLFDANKNAIANGAFPQNYIGAFPYCYRLPVYKDTGFPPQPQVESHQTHTEGAGSTEVDEALAPTRKLQMGQAPGTHWYHAHKHGSTTLNIANGMTGAFIIEGVYDDEIKAFYNSYGGIKEQVIVLNQIGVTPRREGGTEQQQGPYVSVNGRLQPNITMHPGEVQMWRIVNTANRSGTLFAAPSGGVTWRQLAQDGVQFNNANYLSSENQSFLLASGNRADLLVKAPRTSSSTIPIPISVTSTTGPSRANVQLLFNVVTDTTAKDMPLMDRSSAVFPPFLQDIEDKEITGHKTLVFETQRDPNAPKFTRHTIDGKLFSGEVGALVLLNNVEEWKVVNKSFGNEAISHPFHIHINPYQIVEVFDPNASTADPVAGPGKVTISKPASGPSVVTGTDGTKFTQTFQPGDWITVGTNRYTVLAVTSDTALTIPLINNALTTATAYQMSRPVYTPGVGPLFMRSAAGPGQCRINLDNESTWTPCSNVRRPRNNWWDVFPIPAGNVFYKNNDPNAPVSVPGYFKMRSRFVDYSGYYVIHCHILAHEDRGMMTVVSIAPLQPPFSHH